MFWHEFSYETRRLLRQKEELFWVLLFPIILGTMFHFAFGNINNASENFHTIPVALCAGDGEAGKLFAETLSLIAGEGETPLLEITDADEKTAQRLLRDREVSGIFKAGEDVTLTCLPANASGATGALLMEQNILEMILREYRSNVAAITELASENPASLGKILSGIGEEASYGKELKVTDGNMDGVIQYFFNLVAMACLFTSFAGSQIATRNQANLSALGARKCASPNRKLVAVTAQYLSCLLTQFFCIAADIFFLVYVLKAEFGTSLPLLLLTAFAGCMTGIGFGFFVGSVGRIGEGGRMGIMVGFSMLGCFLSGLMDSEMRMRIESFCPVVNDINPAARISDAFLTLDIYGANARYAGNLAALFAMAVLFLGAGCLLIRRKTYASL